MTIYYIMYSINVKLFRKQLGNYYRKKTKNRIGSTWCLQNQFCLKTTYKNLHVFSIFHKNGPMDRAIFSR